MRDRGNPVLNAAIASLGRFRHRIPPPVLEEFAQEATLRSFASDAVRDPPAFASRTARNLAIDWLRRPRETSLGTWDGAVSWDRQLEARLDGQRARQLLSRAPSAYRTTLQALYLDDLPVEQLVDRSTGDRARVRDLIYKRRRRGLAWLRARLSS